MCSWDDEIYGMDVTCMGTWYGNTIMELKREFNRGWWVYVKFGNDIDFKLLKKIDKNGISGISVEC